MPELIQSVELRYRPLREHWQSATAHLSLLQRKVRHPAFREIVALGVTAIPWILRDLGEHPDLCWALEEITGESPLVEPGGGLERLVGFWIEWGRSRGYVE